MLEKFRAGYDARAAATAPEIDESMVDGLIEQLRPVLRHLVTDITEQTGLSNNDEYESEFKMTGDSSESLTTLCVSLCVSLCVRD